MSSSKSSEPGSPRECLAKCGADSLSIQEFLAVLLFPGHRKDKVIEIAINLMKTFDEDLIDLFTATIHQLTRVKGIGFAKVCKIKVVNLKKINKCQTNKKCNGCFILEKRKKRKKEY